MTGVMKTVKGFWNLGARLVCRLCMAGSVLVLCAPLPSVAINTVASGTTAAQPEASPQQVAPPVRYSAGVADVLKMMDAKVDPAIIQAYVKSSSVAYNLNAGEIITLRDHGVPADVLTAMIQRGGELRGQAARASQVAAPPQVQPPYPATAAPYAPAPAYDYS